MPFRGGSGPARGFEGPRASGSPTTHRSDYRSCSISCAPNPPAASAGSRIQTGGERRLGGRRDASRFEGLLPAGKLAVRLSIGVTTAGPSDVLRVVALGVTGALVRCRAVELGCDGGDQGVQGVGEETLSFGSGQFSVQPAAHNDSVEREEDRSISRI